MRTEGPDHLTADTKCSRVSFPFPLIKQKAFKMVGTHHPEATSKERGLQATHDGLECEQ